MTQIIKTVAEFLIIRESENYENDSVGFVPTMGALHKGHLSLINKSKDENDITVVSIFVNPTQFNDKSDFENYPNTLENDLQKLNEAEVDFLFLPNYAELYSDNYKYNVTENELSKKLCGAYRPGHFDGVLTVVMKLLNIVRADCAYFGEKDYQQFLLIKGMTEALFIDTEIISVPTIRDEDGLALSSRNVRLSKEDREKATLFPQLLKYDTDSEKIKAMLEEDGFKVDYIETIGGRRFGAVHLGGVRLIDNVKI
ncbi:MAG: pantoate--beta-alanine ligase [Bacteroidetes bacterium]|nr:pantoate--beta-alanine ligase [Bacteroidota bacterium]MBU1117232.1 pantoate--beta-alanine ligase [Bacteroidota bacterium]MBU1800296.1 pantoate--beta-alanine ligase [Bacteroidota bacterium]